MATFPNGFYPTEKIVDSDTIATTTFVNGVYPGRSHGNIGGLHTVSTNSLPKKTILPGRRKKWCIIGVVVVIVIIICLALALGIRKKKENVCAPDPCRYGVCHDTGHDDFICNCDIGYTGTHCETRRPIIEGPRDACHDRPCKRGVCQATSHGFRCECPPGYTGMYCEVYEQGPADACRPNPCIRGTCHSNQYGFQCQCPTGYSGQLCEQSTVTPNVCLPDPCARGWCKPAAWGFQCMCPSGYTGTNCEREEKLHRFNCVKTPLGQEYTGTIAVTKAGIMCQRWDSQYPQVHTDNDPDKFPEDSVEAAMNYCRNPDDDPLGNWCYTSDPDISWDFCAIPNCDVYEDACMPSPCNRGDCELTHDQSGYNCHCPMGYYGINCEITPTMPLNETVCKRTTGGKEYTGQLAVTLSGRTCQRWDSEYPHRHQGFEDHEARDTSAIVGSSSWAHNYCRNPGGWLFGPWCYTMDPDVEWEFCAVPFCSTLETAFCRITNFGKEYVGTMAVTVTGLPCISWELGIPYGSDNDDPEEFPEDSIRDAKNYCRNPAWELLGPWCYVDHPDMDWQYCSVPMCSGHTDPCEQRPCLNGYCQSRGFAYTCHCEPGHYGKHCETPRTVDPSKCKITGSGSEYNGTLAVSMSGLECQRWDSDFPHIHTAKNPSDFHVYYLGDVHNYCRNPEYDDNGPWCYTTSPTIRWEYCSVPYC